jgi:2,3-bisphosphoglycerate-independent phosphoglycerate mutase
MTCILTILGVTDIPPFLRGYVEALGSDVPVQKDDLILRASWFAVEDGRCTVPMPAPLEINMVVNARYFCLGGYKSLLVLPGLAACAESIGTYPFYRRSEQTVDNLRPTGNAILERIFDENCTDCSCMAPWGQSRMADLPPFPRRAAVICGAEVVRGIAKLLNMALIHVPGATGDTDTDLEAKSDAALQAAQDYPFVLLHINGADEAAHRRDAGQKKRFLSDVDRLVLRRLLYCGHTVFVTADHSSDPVSGLHGGVDQPVFWNRYS